MSASASWPRRTAWSFLPEPLLDHHLLAVVRPAFDERGRREEDRLAQLRLDLAQVLVVQEVAREHLVDRDRPERAVAEVAQVLVLAFRRPGGIDVGDVVVARAAAGLRTDPASTCWRTSSDRTAASARPRPVRRCGIVTIRWRLRNWTSSASCCCADGDQLAGGRVVVLGLAPGGDRIAAVHARRDAAELLLRLVQLADGDREQPVGVERDALVELELLLEPVATEPERRPCSAAPDPVRGTRCSRR